MGGGVALLRAAEALKRVRTQNDDQKTGVDIVRKALSAARREPCPGLLQPHQALPGHRRSLRQVPRKIPRRRQTHLRGHLVHCMWR
jgi:hypothetical protein